MEQAELELHLANHTLPGSASALEQAYHAALAAGEIRHAALAANDLGVIDLLLGRYEDARARLDAAQRLFIESGDLEGQGRATGNLAQLKARTGDADGAGALYMQAADLLHDAGAFAEEYVTRQKLSKIYLTYGATLMSLRERALALAVKPHATFFDRLQCRLFALPLRWIGV